MTATTPSPTGVAKHPGAEPLPGYRLLKLLGRGGFGEVWKCEAPGRLHKAIKFVSGDHQFRTELAAFEHMRTIRHPYLMTLERVEAVAGELVMVMELADGHVNDRFRACVADGLRGIPRDELLGYLHEAAEALDFLGRRYGLQHLDVKPENLLLLAGHVKLGDYGLVRRADPNPAAESEENGFTPRYTPPEVFGGRVDQRSDQYSLALVYVELATGVFPFSGKSAQQLLLQHHSAAPNLSAVPANERGVVGRALSKDPAARFASSSEFIRALYDIEDDVRAVGTVAGGRASTEGSATADGAAEPDQRPADETTWRGRAGTDVEHPVYGSGGSHPPTTRRLSTSRTAPQPPRPAVLQDVVSTDRLKGMAGHKVPAAAISKDGFVRAVVNVAAQACRRPETDAPPGAIVRQFLSTFPPSLIPLKLAVIANSRNLRIDQDGLGRVALRYEAPAKMRLLRRPPPKSGFEVAIHLPTDASAVMALVGSYFGAPDRELLRRTDGAIEAVMDEVRRQLENKVERRAHPRFPADVPILAYPYYTDGEVDTPVAGRCRDISEGGIRFASPLPVRSGLTYVEFMGVEDVAGAAVLVQVIRTGHDAGGEEFITAGRFGGGG